MTNVKNDILWRIYLVYICIFLFAVAIISRVVYIQYAEGEYWEGKAKKPKVRLVDFEVKRGNIYAADGFSLLATSVPVFEVRMDVACTNIDDKYFNTRVDSLARELSKLFKNKSATEYKKILIKARNKNNRSLLLARNVSYKDLKKLRTFPIFKLGKYKGGLIVIEDTRREYPFKDLATRTIGYERKGYLVGLEGSYNKELSGTTSKRLMVKNANNEWMPTGDVVDPEDPDAQIGYDVISTIDVSIQDVAQNALRKCLDTNKAEHGCVILMEVKTGYIKAIANLTKVGEHQYEERFNYAIGERLEPGSTFKLMSLVALLEDGLADTSDKVDVTGATCQFAGRNMNDSHDYGYTNISLKRVFEVSSNVGVSKLIYKAYAKDPKMFTDRLYEFGIHQRLGIKLFGESQPYIKNPEDKTWWKTSLPWMSIGYELLITPLQILNFYNTIANNGVTMRPQFVKEIRRTGQVLQSFDPEIINSSAVSEKTALKARAMLEAVVEHGTAKKLNNSIYKIAGKTGTAQIVEDGKISSFHRASFVGYFPADNPQYSCIAIIHKPTAGKYYGGDVAAPVFKEVADLVYATNLNIQPKNKQSYSKDTTQVVKKLCSYDDLMTVNNILKFAGVIPATSAEWVDFDYSSGRKTEPAVQMKPLVIAQHTVPNTIGMNLRDAIYFLENKGLRVQATGRGVVKNQIPAPGTPLKPNTTVKLEMKL